MLSEKKMGESLLCKLPHHLVFPSPSATESFFRVLQDLLWAPRRVCGGEVSKRYELTSLHLSLSRVSYFHICLHLTFRYLKCCSCTGLYCVLLHLSQVSKCWSSVSLGVCVSTDLRLLVCLVISVWRVHEKLLIEFCPGFAW